VSFAQAEAQFTLAGISSEQTKFCYVISQLDQCYAVEVQDIIISPPERDPYSILKAELVTRLSPSREQRIRQFLTLEMGDHKPSQFLRQLRSLVLDVSDDFLHSIWFSRLPPNVRAILTCQSEGDLDATGRCAHCIIEAAPQPALMNVVPLPDSNALTEQIEDLSPGGSTQHRVDPPSLQLQGSLPPKQETTLGQQIPLLRGRYIHPLPVPSPLWSPGKKVYSALLLQPARKTNTADINGGTCLHPIQRPFLHHGQDQ
jgi:hypothetical protein